jgi:hypothetical protein
MHDVVKAALQPTQMFPSCLLIRLYRRSQLPGAQSGKMRFSTGGRDGCSTRPVVSTFTTAAGYKARAKASASWNLGLRAMDWLDISAQSGFPYRYRMLTKSAEEAVGAVVVQAEHGELRRGGDHRWRRRREALRLVDADVGEADQQLQHCACWETQNC